MAVTDPQPPVTVRRSRSTDAAELAALFAVPHFDSPATADADLRAAIADFGERISIPPGDDYFTLVATATGCDALVGWCAAGGAAHQQLKGWGEIYTLELIEGPSADPAAYALASATLHRLALAGYESVAWWVQTTNERDVERAAMLGFNPDGHANGPLRRYARSLADLRNEATSGSG